MVARCVTAKVREGRGGCACLGVKCIEKIGGGQCSAGENLSGQVYRKNVSCNSDGCTTTVTEFSFHPLLEDLISGSDGRHHEMLGRIP